MADKLTSIFQSLFNLIDLFSPQNFEIYIFIIIYLNNKFIKITL